MLADLRPRGPVGFHRPDVQPERQVGEAGSALILALLFLGVVMTLVTVLFAGATTGARSVKAYRSDRTVRYGADAAIDATITLLKNNPSLGAVPQTGTTPACGLRMPLQDATGARQTVTSGSYLVATCTPFDAATPGYSGVAPDIVQSSRDVLIVITCAPTVPVSNGITDCKGGSTPREVARARVRFDVDPGSTPSSSWAKVPKVVSWTVYR